MSKLDELHDLRIKAKANYEVIETMYLQELHNQVVAIEAQKAQDKINQLKRNPDGFTFADFVAGQAAILRLELMEADHDDLEEQLYNLYSHHLESQNAKLGTQNRAGYVYLLFDHESGRCKIGRAKNWQKRAKQFGVDLPFRSSVFHVIRCRDMVSAETMLHDRYRQYRTNGEWFALNDNQIEEIKAIREL